MFMGIDIGYGWTKVATGLPTSSDMLQVRASKFPSAIAPIIDLRLHQFNSSENGAVQYGQKHYIVGKHALSSPNCLRGRDLEWMLQYGPILMAKAIRSASPYALSGHTVALGLPPADYGRYKERFIEHFSTIEIDNQTIENTIKVFPQALVSLAELKARGKSVDNVLVVDIGFNTVDVVPVMDGHIHSDAAGTLDQMGVCKIFDGTRDAIRRAFGVALSDAQLDNTFARGTVSVMGTQHDVSDLLTKELELYRDILINMLQTRWSRFWRTTECVVLIGGGAAFWQRYLDSAFSDCRFYAMPQPEYANARGYLLLAAQRKLSLVTPASAASA